MTPPPPHAALPSLPPQIWRRPLHRLPVHKDVPRLLKGMLVLGAEVRRR